MTEKNLALVQQNEIRVVRLRGYQNLIFQQFNGSDWKAIPLVEMERDQYVEQFGDVPSSIEKSRKYKTKPKPKPQAKESRPDPSKPPLKRGIPYSQKNQKK